MEKHLFFSGGGTLHGAFKLGKWGTTYKALTDNPRDELRENLADLRLVIVDELSLVSADMLYTIHMRLQEICSTHITTPFADLNIILVGDLLQLPPVQGTFIFKTPLNIKYQANKDTLDLWGSFKPKILKYNHRQGEAGAWTQALNEFRVGNVTEEGEAMLRERQTTEPFLDAEAMHIFYENADVKKHNDRMLNSLPSQLVSITAAQKLKKGCRSIINSKKGTIGETQFLETLNIKIGARVNLIYNVNVIDGLVNGAYGKVVGIESINGSVECIIVKFDDDLTGHEQRMRYPQFSQKYKNQNGTPIFKMVHEHDLITRNGGHSSPVPAKLYKFPLNLSYAQRAHRMQGQTVNAGTKVIIHWVKAMKRGMAYVMLGRSQRLEDIYIAGELDPSQIKCDPEALEESERLEEIFNKNQAEEAERRSKMWKVSYLNVRSLNAHLNDVKKDNFPLDSDLLGLAETWIDGGNLC